MQPSRSRSNAEVFNIWGQRPDATAYFDPTPNAVVPAATPRIFVPRFRKVFVDHFLGDSLDAKWNLTTQGTPTTGAIQNARHGVFRLALAATNEAETNELNFADNLQFHTTEGLVMEVGFSITAAIAANERVVIGFGSARNNTYDSVATNIWFRVDGDMDLLTEADDGTTDVDDTDTGQDLSAGVFHFVRIDCGKSHNSVKFYAGASFPTEVNSGTTHAAGPNLVQPIIGIQKASGTGTPALDVDYVGIWSRR